MSAVTILGTAILALLLAGYLSQQYLPPPTPRIMGIDLGTTYSCVGIYHAVSGETEVIVGPDDSDTIPSIVAFTHNDTLIGFEALRQAEENSLATFYDAKRFIGKVFSPEELRKEEARYPFKIKQDNGAAKFAYSIPGNSSELLVSPEYIGSRIVLELKQRAEEFLGIGITRAVLAVPADFDERQRNYTAKAASLAGLDVLRIISEPTAAALAYGVHKRDGVEHVMVIDLGGGTLDVSLLQVQGGMFITMAIAGNNHLGGQDFNQRLREHLLRAISEHYHQPLADLDDKQKLWLAVEEAKLNLTLSNSTLLTLPLTSLDPQPFARKLTRQLFEELNSDLFNKVLEPVKLVLAETGLMVAEVDEIILVGGSTRIPKIRQLFRDFFGKDLNFDVDPDLAVAKGVAIQAGIIGGMWPLRVSAIEFPRKKGLKKILIN